jgi:hypothetical protein
MARARRDADGLFAVQQARRAHLVVAEPRRRIARMPVVLEAAIIGDLVSVPLEQTRHLSFDRLRESRPIAHRSTLQ